MEAAYKAAADKLFEAANEALEPLKSSLEDRAWFAGDVALSAGFYTTPLRLGAYHLEKDGSLSDYGWRIDSRRDSTDHMLGQVASYCDGAPAPTS